MPNQPPAPAASSGSLKDWCRLLFVLLSFLALLPLIGVLSIILVGPLKPKFDLQSGEVQYLNIATDNITGTAAASITLTIRLVFIADNPNKMEMKYGESRFAVLYNDIPLGNGSIPGFFQGGHSAKQVVATIFVDGMRLLQDDATGLINSSLNDQVYFQVLVDVNAKTRVKNLYSPGVRVSVECDIMIRPREQTLTSKPCEDV